MLRWLTLALALVLPACAQTVQAPPAALTPTPADAPILLTRTALPSPVLYQIIGPIVVHKTTHGQEAWVFDRLAAAARQVGANAVMRVTTRFAPSWGGWATPRGAGIAIRILEPGVNEVGQLPAVQAEWR